MYETNTASTRIWDSLGFKRVGRIPGCGVLKSSSEPVDAIIYGRELGGDGEDFVSEERFEKIRYYLKHGKYPVGADRAEKSRLRSAATHYKLVPGDDGAEQEKLMLKGKEVISDPQQQYDIAQQFHAVSHGGINKTTAIIAVKYHWVRIKETVSLAIKNCVLCREASNVPTVFPEKRAKDLPQHLLTQDASSAHENTFGPHDNDMLQDHAFGVKQNPFGHEDHGLPDSMQDHLSHYGEMAIDPHLVQELQMHARFATSQDPYSQASLPPGPHALPHPDFAPTQMHQHRPDGFHVGEDDSMIVEAAAAALEPETSIDLVDDPNLDPNEHIPQHLLSGNYVDGDGSTSYDQ